ncbi:MAG: hypothetical protein IKF51_06660 [Solobacterium sp.]|nr:hypothetical protein [Solobacterium sp.]
MFILAGIWAITYALVQAANRSQNNTGTVNNRRQNRYGYTERVNGNAHSASDLAKINVFLRKQFRNNNSLVMADGLELVLRTQRYNTLSNLDVYINGRHYGTINEFRNSNRQMYDTMFDTLLAMAEDSTRRQDAEVVDAEYVSPAEKAKEKPKAEVKKETVEETKSAYFIRKINDNNANIPDEEITNNLYETCALLKQIQLLERKFPESADKMQKMYDYYLPYLVKILDNFENLQTIKSDANYEKNVNQLKSTVKSINEALETIIPTMSDSHFTDLSADMATLEALLKKEGLTGGMDISEPMERK